MVCLDIVTQNFKSRLGLERTKVFFHVFMHFFNVVNYVIIKSQSDIFGPDGQKCSKRGWDGKALDFEKFLVILLF